MPAFPHDLPLYLDNFTLQLFSVLWNLQIQSTTKHNGKIMNRELRIANRELGIGNCKW
jgi:hypothetical protein